MKTYTLDELMAGLGASQLAAIERRYVELREQMIRDVSESSGGFYLRPGLPAAAVRQLRASKP